MTQWDTSALWLGHLGARSLQIACQVTEGMPQMKISQEQAKARLVAVGCGNKN